MCTKSPRQFFLKLTDPVLSSLLVYMALGFFKRKYDLQQFLDRCNFSLISGVWPVLSRVMEIYASDSRIMERTCRTLRFVIRCIGTQSAPLVEPLVQRLVRLYIEHPHSCFLYLVSFFELFFYLPYFLKQLPLMDSFFPYFLNLNSFPFLKCKSLVSYDTV